MAPILRRPLCGWIARRSRSHNSTPQAKEDARMDAQIQLGWKAGPEQYPPNELLDYATAAEQAGFETIDCSDHFHPWSESGQACFTWTWLGAVAVRTSRIHLG